MNEYDNRTEKNNHFIEKIEIRKFKCFDGFKADGFKRVNLIAGKNNVGKTAFMEAIYLYTSQHISMAYKRLLVLKTYRNIHEMLLSNTKDEDNLKALILENDDIDIGIDKKEQSDIPIHEDDNYILDAYHLSNVFKITKDKNGDFEYRIKNVPIYVTDESYTDSNENSKTFGVYEEYTRLHNKKYSLTQLANKLNSSIVITKCATSRIFIGSNLNDNELLENIIGDLKLNAKYDDLNKYLNQLLDIENIDFINKKPMIKINNKYKELSTLGEGIKSIVFYIGSLLTLKDEYIFIDEIENGIHYMLLDDIWEIILRISKECNVQVFATTHSKECIESYQRVAKKLKDEDISFIELGKNKENILKANVMDCERFNRNIKIGNGVRGW